MSGPLNLNRSYNFVDKLGIVDELRTAIEDSGETIDHIALRAGVSSPTIYSMLNGKVRRPYSTTLEGIARALGKHLELADGALHLVDPPPPPRPKRGQFRHVIQMSKYRNRNRAP